MTTRLGPAGFAAGIHHLISASLADDLGAPGPSTRPALLAACDALAQVTGAPVDPEEDPDGGLAEARVFLLCAEVLVQEADRLAAPAFGSDGMLTSRFIDVLTELGDAEELLAEDDEDEPSA